ncbi:glycosyltransferase family 2 protein [Corallincola platygyrae]|uniref:Glycosyltransferase family 2 protein n=1 Tax=Corallincola platygyrae TaxID=1193278 RepID=A0ABW4XRU6_9GAMM
MTADADTPLVSVITPVYRGEQTLVRAVKSLLGQDYPHWEQWIIMDDGHDYQALLSDAGIDDPRIHFIRSEGIGTGPNRTRNLALELAAGQIIAPLDADDLFYPSRLSTLVPLALKYGVAGDNVRVVDETDNQPMADLFPLFDGYRTLPLDEYLQTTTPCVFLFRRDCVKQGWSPDVILGEDTLFNLRAMEQADRCVLWGAPLHEYRVNTQSICHSDDAASRADNSYQHCLARIRNDGMGFESLRYLEKVEQMLIRKKQINLDYDVALKAGFDGSYQHFVLQDRLANGDWEKCCSNADKQADKQADEQKESVE